jgi:cobalt-zinc-cadmium resistance protein CzcA
VVGGQEMNYGSSKRFHYVSAGIGIPIFFKAQNARIAAAKLQWESNKKQTDLIGLQVQHDYQNALQQVAKFRQSLQYYENEGLNNADLIITTADQQFQGGDIDFLQWALVVDQAIAIKTEYINALSGYNQAVIKLLKMNNL